MRVLQTLAFPLGHVAILFDQKSGRWDSNPRPSPWQGDVLPTEPRPLGLPRLIENAESQNRTGDTMIFSHVLYQLSYLGENILVVKRLYFTQEKLACQLDFGFSLPDFGN